MTLYHILPMSCTRQCLLTAVLRWKRVNLSFYLYIDFIEEFHSRGNKLLWLYYRYEKIQLTDILNSLFFHSLEKNDVNSSLIYRIYTRWLKKKKKKKSVITLMRVLLWYNFKQTVSTCSPPLSTFLESSTGDFKNVHGNIFIRKGEMIPQISFGEDSNNVLTGLVN